MNRIACLSVAALTFITPPVAARELRRHASHEALSGMDVADRPTMPVTAADMCLTAIAAAERRYGTPSGLLLAIARTESGRLDPETGRVQPWPWTVNANGVGVYLSNKAEAVAYVAKAAKDPGASTDTGCMQVNLQQHPNAFQTTDDSFDARLNADYAARFLVSLHTQTGDWGQATAFYHSHTPSLGLPYRAAVEARMTSPGLPTEHVASSETLILGELKKAWAATQTDNAPAPAIGWSGPSPAPRANRLAEQGTLPSVVLR